MAWASGDVLIGTVLTRCLQGSAQCFAGASRYVLAGCANRDGFDAVFAVLCAVFRRGERGCTCGDGFDAVFAGFCASYKIK